MDSDVAKRFAMVFAVLLLLFSGAGASDLPTSPVVTFYCGEANWCGYFPDDTWNWVSLSEIEPSQAKMCLVSSPQFSWCSYDAYVSSEDVEKHGYPTWIALLTTLKYSGYEPTFSKSVNGLTVYISGTMYGELWGKDMTPDGQVHTYILLLPDERVNADVYYADGRHERYVLHYESAFFKYDMLTGKLEGRGYLKIEYNGVTVLTLYLINTEQAYTALSLIL